MDFGSNTESQLYQLRSTDALNNLQRWAFKSLCNSCGCTSCQHQISIPSSCKPTKRECLLHSQLVLMWHCCSMYWHDVLGCRRVHRVCACINIGTAVKVQTGSAKNYKSHLSSLFVDMNHEWSYLVKIIKRRIAIGLRLYGESVGDGTGRDQKIIINDTSAETSICCC